MYKFPSLEWFDAVRKEFNADDSFRGAGGGRCDCFAGFQIGDDLYVAQFEGFEVSSVAHGTDEDRSKADFYLEMPVEQWCDMGRNIAANGQADLGYTLNTIDLSLLDGLSRSVHGDQYREDLFFRYNQTMQFFFDASSRIETVFT